MSTVINVKKLLNEKGYKYTEQRKKILDVLIEQGAKHLTSADICELVKKKHPDIGVSTIYRSLLIFETLHIINKLGPNDELNRYEFNKNNDTYKHYHLICIKCDKITDIKEDFMNEINEKILVMYGFEVSDNNQSLYGICEDCAKKLNKI